MADSMASSSPMTLTSSSATSALVSSGEGEVNVTRRAAMPARVKSKPNEWAGTAHSLLAEAMSRAGSGSGSDASSLKRAATDTSSDPRSPSAADASPEQEHKNAAKKTQDVHGDPRAASVGSLGTPAATSIRLDVAESASDSSTVEYDDQNQILANPRRIPCARKYPAAS